MTGSRYSSGKDSNSGSVRMRARAPADENMLLGADQLGRDMFSRIIYGARNSVGLALTATALAFILGALAGLLAATKGGWFDQLMGRVADVIKPRASK